MKKVMHWLMAAILAGCVPVGLATAASEEDMLKQIQALGWQKGPAKSALGTRANIAIAAHTAILGEADSSKFLELTGNLPSPETNILSSDTWWATFEFDPVGYVKDDEKIDADALLKQIKEGDGPGNEERRKRGLAELTTDGWHIPPHYDAASKHLEWALKLHASDNPAPVINYTVRLLGRTGYERVTLVSSPEHLDDDVKTFKATLGGFDFNAGEKYSEFKQGDRVAEFGLAALVAGGAAAVIAKTGFWKVILATLAASWKLIMVGGIAVLATLGKVFKKNRPQ